MPYEWDEAKRLDNIQKHGVDFTAVRRFHWPTATRDRSVRQGEERFLSLGYVGDRVHAVVYVRRGGNIRIISMRKANPREVERYDAP